MSLEWETVRVDGDGPVRHLVLNRPEVHNAVNSQLIADVNTLERHYTDRWMPTPECGW